MLIHTKSDPSTRRYLFDHVDEEVRRRLEAQLRLLQNSFEAEVETRVQAVLREKRIEFEVNARVAAELERSKFELK
jgi:hypothetical protein